MAEKRLNWCYNNETDDIINKLGDITNKSEGAINNTDIINKYDEVKFAKISKQKSSAGFLVKEQIILLWLLMNAKLTILLPVHGLFSLFQLDINFL